jgi:hypothetical protein
MKKLTKYRLQAAAFWLTAAVLLVCLAIYFANNLVPA